jgi:hypothetical protein
MQKLVGPPGPGGKGPYPYTRLFSEPILTCVYQCSAGGEQVENQGQQGLSAVHLEQGRAGRIPQLCYGESGFLLR